jgi:hypothetical protein
MAKPGARSLTDRSGHGVRRLQPHPIIGSALQSVVPHRWHRIQGHRSNPSSGKLARMACRSGSQLNHSSHGSSCVPQCQSGQRVALGTDVAKAEGHVVRPSLLVDVAVVGLHQVRPQQHLTARRIAQVHRSGEVRLQGAEIEKSYDSCQSVAAAHLAILKVGSRLDPVTRSPPPERQLSQLPAVRRLQPRLTCYTRNTGRSPVMAQSPEPNDSSLSGRSALHDPSATPSALLLVTAKRPRTQICRRCSSGSAPGRSGKPA